MIYKLFHGSNLLTCNEQFAIGKSVVGLIIWEVVKVINIEKLDFMDSGTKDGSGDVRIQILM